MRSGCPSFPRSAWERNGATLRVANQYAERTGIPSPRGAWERGVLGICALAHRIFFANGVKSMQWSFFRIPVTGGAEGEELNRFLRTVRVLNLHREFVNQGDASYWAVAVEYLQGDVGTRQNRDITAPNRVDYRAILSPEDFALFARLREWRKEEGTKDGAPVYTIFTNEQLAEIARRRPSSSSVLSEIDGVGKGRVEKFGAAALEIVKGFVNGEG